MTPDQWGELLWGVLSKLTIAQRRELDRLLFAADQAGLNGNTAAQVQAILEGMRGFKAVMGGVSEQDLKNLDREYVLVRTHGWG